MFCRDERMNRQCVSRANVQRAPTEKTGASSRLECSLF